MKILPVARNSDIIIQELKGELLVYDLRANLAFCLNQTAALVWNLCDGRTSISDISRELGKMLQSPVPEDFVWLALDILKANNLLIDSPAIEINFNGLSRREVMRKIGFASMLALPLVATALAPPAAQAQSLTCLALGDICTAGAACCSGTCQAFGVCVTCVESHGFPFTGGCSTGTNSEQCCSKTCDPENLSACL